MRLNSYRKSTIPLWVTLGIPACLAFVVFANTLQNGFVYDDAWKIKLLPDSWPPLYKLFELRGLTYFSQVLDRMIWGQVAPGFHLTNILLHALASGLAALAALSLAGSRRLALITGLLFAVHPVHVEAVASFANRKDILAMIFVGLAIISWRSRRFPVLGYVLAWLCLACGFLCKEVAVIGLIPMLLLADLLLFQKDTAASGRLRRANLRIAPFALLAIGSAVFLWRKLREFFTADFIYGITDQQVQSYPQILANSLAAVPDLFRLLFWPLRLSADYPPIRDLPLSAPQALFGLALLLLWTALAIFLRRRQPVAAYAMLWPVIMYVACSNLVPLNRFFVAERYLYVPSFGACLLLGYLFDRGIAAGTNVRYRAGVVALLLILLVAGSGRSHLRNHDWHDGPSLWSAAITAGFGTWRSHYNLGFELKEAGLYDRAIDHFERSRALFPERREIEAILISSLVLADRHHQAEERCLEILSRRSGEPECHYARAVARESRGDLEQAIESSERALTADPNHLETLVLLARLYATAPEKHLRDGDRALELSEHAVRLTRSRHDHPEVLLAVAISHDSLGNGEAAREWGLKALNLARLRGKDSLSSQIASYLAILERRSAPSAAADLIEPAAPRPTPRVEGLLP